jgi:hypothetical protein
MKAFSIIILMSLFVLTSCSPDKKTATKEVAKEVKETMTDTKKIHTIALEQTPGEFNQKSLSLKEGIYVFDIANKGVDHEVGFVLAPKGKTDQANHIKEAYVTAPVKTGTSSKTNEVTLTKGEYVYFCPLNPTEQYPLVVK